jgi:hypothetical protein
MWAVMCVCFLVQKHGSVAVAEGMCTALATNDMAGHGGHCFACKAVILLGVQE